MKAANGGGQARRAEAIRALKAAAASPVVASQPTLVANLLDLIAALEDLDRGKVHPAFRPFRKAND